MRQTRQVWWALEVKRGPYAQTAVLSLYVPPPTGARRITDRVRTCTSSHFPTAVRGIPYVATDAMSALRNVTEVS